MQALLWLSRNRKRIGFSLLLTLCFLYSYNFGYRFFAKAHFNIPVLNIPIFPGEIVLFACVILAAPDYLQALRKRSKWALLLAIFLLFIVAKAACGLFIKGYGAFALRNAALFYYMLFSFISYSFFNKDARLNRNVLHIAFAAIVLLIYFELFNHYYYYLYLTLLSVITLVTSRSWRGLVLRFFIILFLIPNRYPFWEANRAWQSGFFVALISLGIGLICMIRLKKKQKILFSVAIFITLIVFMLTPKLRNYFFARFNISGIQKEYKFAKQKIIYMPKKITQPSVILYEPLVKSDELDLREEVHDENKFTAFLKRAIEPKMKRRKRIRLMNKILFEKLPVQYAYFVSELKSIQELDKKLEENPQDYGSEKIKELRVTYFKRIKILNEKMQYDVAYDTKVVGCDDPFVNETNKKLLGDLGKIVNAISSLNEWANFYHGDIYKASQNKLTDKKFGKASSNSEIIVKNDSMQTSVSKAQDNNVKKASLDTGHGTMVENYLVSGNSAKPSAADKMDTSAIDFSKGFSMNNALWRILVWEDMMNELMKANLLIGVDFGKPFYPIQVAKLGWETGRDMGWIEPHNSYVDILYRAGIFGGMLICLIWFVWLRMFYLFIKHREPKGIFLCSALLFWLVLASFIVFFELPYFAIPFWCLFGVTLAYCDKITVKGSKERIC